MLTIEEIEKALDDARIHHTPLPEALQHVGTWLRTADRSLVRLDWPDFAARWPSLPLEARVAKVAVVVGAQSVGPLGIICRAYENLCQYQNVCGPRALV